MRTVSRWNATVASWAFVLLFGLLAGCHAARVADPLTARLAAGDADTQFAFWDELSRRPVACNDEAFHGLLLYLDKTDPAADYPARVRALQSRGLLPPAFDRPADEAVGRGTVAHAVARALGIQGGLMMRLTGGSPRYALLELEDRGLLPPSSENQGFTGLEFMGVLSKVEDVRRGGEVAVARLATAPADVAPGPLPDGIAPRGEGDRGDPADFADPDPDPIAPLYLAAAFRLQQGPPPVTAPASQPAPAGTGGPLAEGPLRIVVTAVEGNVRTGPTDRGPWTPVRAGMELSEGAWLKTVPDARMLVEIVPGQSFLLAQASTLNLVRARFQGGRIVTDAFLPHGRMNYSIEGGGRDHDGQIRSPNSTLAVRGTEVSLYDQPPYPPEAVSLTGVAEFRDARKALAFGATGARDRVVASTVSPTVAELALAGSVVDPTIARARTASERPLVDNLISRGAVTFFDSGAQIRVVEGGTPPTIQSLRASRSGLNFVVSWTGDADLNLSVSEAGTSNFVYPIGGINVTRSGARIPFDHRGGPNGGYEIARFPLPRSPASSEFTIGVTNVSGEPVQTFLDAFVRGGDFPNGAILQITPLGVPGAGLVNRYDAGILGPGDSAAAAASFRGGSSSSSAGRATRAGSGVAADARHPATDSRKVRRPR